MPIKFYLLLKAQNFLFYNDLCLILIYKLNYIAKQSVGSGVHWFNDFF